jgi:hypothetical protein
VLHVVSYLVISYKPLVCESKDIVCSFHNFHQVHRFFTNIISKENRFQDSIYGGWKISHYCILEMRRFFMCIF